MLQNPFTRTPAKIAVIGLGYVGLPLAVAFAAEHEVVGFDTGDGLCCTNRLTAGLSLSPDGSIP